jgi:hypothetical protein
MYNCKAKVALIIPSTSKNRDWKIPEDSLLYQMITSFKQTTNEKIECKFFIGVDFDDLFFSGEENINFFKNQNVSIDFFQLTCEKGHVTKMWNILANKAYNEGYDYLYACGDDCIFNKLGWLSICINNLTLNNNIGLTGPLTTNGNTNILTQCFVHKTHFEIFGFFYPEEIKNWYCDDWINNIYIDHLFKLPIEYSCSNSGGSERYDVVMCEELQKTLTITHKIQIEDYIGKKINKLNNIVILCDYNYLHYAVALLLSISCYEKNNVLIHFLCLDEKTYSIISNLQLEIDVICYKEDIFLNETTLNDLKCNDKRYYFWALASYFSNYIMTQVLRNTSASLMYIDSDIYFHKDFHMLYKNFSEKDVGIFKHRFDSQAHLDESGMFNVGVVYFKNSEKGKEILSWWTDAVLNKKYSELGLNTCGDQKYLNKFPEMCLAEEIYIDENIGHGAPWNWKSYSNIDSESYEVVYKDQVQPLVFTHFSKFNFDFEKGSYSFGNYECFTDNNSIFELSSLKKIHNEYFEQLKRADDLIKNTEI